MLLLVSRRRSTPQHATANQVIFHAASFIWLYQHLIWSLRHNSKWIITLNGVCILISMSHFFFVLIFLLFCHYLGGRVYFLAVGNTGLIYLSINGGVNWASPRTVKGSLTGTMYMHHFTTLHYIKLHCPASIYFHTPHRLPTPHLLSAYLFIYNYNP